MKSFAGKVRDSLTREDVLKGEKPCCRRAELTGFSLSSGAFSLLGGGNMRMTLRTEHAGAARRMVRILRADSGVTPVLRAATASRLGGRTTFEIRLEQAEAVSVMRGLALSPLSRAVPRHCLLKKCCRSAFLRGVFLGCGTIADPESGYQLEWVLSDEGMAQSISRLLQAFYGLKPGVASRKGAWVVYVKESDGIISVLSLIGAYGAILEMENVRILREARNKANRAVNCDAANIAKMLGASDRQIQAIAVVERAIGIQALPESLRQIALERRQHPDASLEELGALLDPPVGKSGVHHRLRRIEAIAQALSNEEKGEES